MQKIIGISCFFHDSAACLVADGKIINAYQEERFSRVKHDSSFPKNSINKLLTDNNLSIEDIDAIVFYEKPFLKFERLIETYVKNSPKGFQSFKKALPIWVKEKLYMKSMIQNEIKNNFLIDYKKVFFSQHHLSHAASAYYPSPYNCAAIIIVDGVGEWASTSLWKGENEKIVNLKQINFPDSIGLLYSAFTQYLGFKVNSGEYKMMGLAPYGEPIYKKLIYDNLISMKNDSSYVLNMKFFNYETGLTMINKNFEKLFKHTKRNSEDHIEKFHADVASSIQRVTEEVYFGLINHLYEITDTENLCLAGGVALNCVANGKIKEKTKFKNIWVQPAAGDAGGSIGAALSFYFDKSENSREVTKPDSMQGSYLGNCYHNEAIKKLFNECNAVYDFIENFDDLIEIVANYLTKGKAVGWFQGKMEFGPRALGNRSIIADPRNINMQKNLNLKVKFRESFRPFAPSILEKEVSNFFEFNESSPYMLMVSKIKKKFQKQTDNEFLDNLIEKVNQVRSNYPAITHIDYTSRLHTVSQHTNPKFFNLIEKFFQITGCPMLVNTSFNIRGEPIVESPINAFNCFMGTDLDMLVCENFILYKDKQVVEIKNYKNVFDLD